MVDPVRVTIETLPAGTQVNLRGDAADPAFTAAMTRVLGVALPTEPGTFSGTSSGFVAWLGPDEWLAVADDPALADRAATAVAGMAHAAVTDVSDVRVGMRLSGPDAPSLLARVTSLDLRPARFPPGACAQTLFAKATVLLMRRSPGAFEVYVWRSFGRYLHALLADAAALVQAGATALPAA